MSTVAITKCSSYSEAEVKEALLNVLYKSNFPNIKGKKVLLKPNILSDSSPSECITTNPQIVRQMIKICFENGATEVYLGDSPGIQGQDFKPIKSGIWEICQQEGAIWQDFTKNNITKTLLKTKTKLPFPSIIEKADVIIGICKMKNHQLMYTTGAVKNFFGTIPGIHKSHCHLKNQSRESFAKLIVDIHETVKPDFSVMDAVIGMEGPGPANGKPRAVGLILASDNDYALDYAQQIIMGYKPENIPITSEALSRKLFSKTIDYSILNPQDLIIKDFVRIPYRKKTQFFRKLIFPFLTRKYENKKRKKEPVPCFIHEKCIHCMRCVNICPAKALIFNKDTKQIEADYSKCIRCYCCHEMCPKDAIKIEKIK